MASSKTSARGLDDILLGIERRHLKKDIPDFRAGDTIRVHVKILEGDKERIQVFQGAVIRRRGAGNKATFTVRKISYGVGVERTFPLHSPIVDKIEVVRTGRVRRGKIYYIRALRGKAARIREKRRRVEVTVEGKAETPEEALAAAADAKEEGVTEASANEGAKDKAKAKEGSE